jgi:hypothetical protein
MKKELLKFWLAGKVNVQSLWDCYFCIDDLVTIVQFLRDCYLSDYLKKSYKIPINQQKNYISIGNEHL